MTDEQRAFLELMGYDDEMHLMNCIGEMDSKMGELLRGYYQKYFPKNLKRNWGFNCHHCGERVQSDKDESYYIVTIIWKDPDKPGKRFCSTKCADVFVAESAEWILNKKKEYQYELAQLRNNK